MNQHNPHSPPASLLAVVDASPAPGLLVSAGGVVLHVNPALRTAGLHRMGLARGAALEDMLSRADVARFRAFLAAKEGAEPVLELALGGPDARVLPTWVTFRVLPSRVGARAVGYVRVSAVEDDLIALARREERWSAALASAGNAVWDTWNPDGEHFVSDTWFDIRGLPRGTSRSIATGAWLAQVHPDDLERLNDTHRRQNEMGLDTTDYQYRYRHADGHWVWIHSRGRVLTRDPDGRPARVVGTDMDITATKQAELELADLANRLHLSIEASGIGLWEFDTAQGIATWDARMREMYGITDGQDKRPGDEWPGFLHPDDREAVLAHADRCLESGRDFNHDYRIVRQDGTVRHLRSRAKYHTDPLTGATRLLGVNIDLTDDVHKTQELEAVRARLEYESRHDALTGLGNRRALDEYRARIEADAARAGRRARASVMHMDLDGFKEINDRLGHAAGDAVLIHAAGILRELVGDSALVVRMGGDEFVILMETAGDGPGPGLIAHRVLERMKTPFHHEDQAFRIAGSIGIAENADPGETIADAFLNADLALYEAKRAGKGCVRTFTAPMRVAAMSKRALADRIRAGLRDGAFVCHFQPQFEARTRSLLGFEALVRWETEDLGLLLPEQFLPSVEAAGLMVQLDDHVIRSALAARASWAEVGGIAPRVSVNISAQLLLDPTLGETLSELEVPEGALCFELLETTFLDREERVLMDNLARIRALGISIEIDDFGSAHASILSFLTVLPERIKIDRRLIEPITISETQCQVVQALAQIAALRGAGVVAEGIETEAHARVATRLGCTVLQGFGIGRPMMGAEALALVRAHAAPVAGRMGAAW